MSKILNPVQYEPVLEELNDIRPLRLINEGKVTLDIPVLNLNPINASKSVIGKLLCLGDNGAAFVSGFKGYKNYEYSILTLTQANPLSLYTFQQRVSGILAGIQSGHDYSQVSWVNPDGTVTYQNIYYPTWYWLDFKGTVISFKGLGTAGFLVVAEFYGFY